MLLSLLLACGRPLEPADTTDSGIDDSGIDDSGVDDSGVDDSGDTGSGDSGDSGDSGIDPGDDEDFLYGTEHILELALELDQAALDSLAADPDTDVHATLTFLDVSYDVGLHLKGSTGSFRDMTEKAAFKIDVHEWDDTQRFHGIKRLALNNMVQDASMSAEHAAYRLFAELGLPAPRHGYAQVTVNGELFGLYGVVEPLDEEFLERWWDDPEGNLYEGGYGGDVARGCADNFQVKEEGDNGDPEDLQTLIDVIEATTAETYFDVLQANFDVDGLLDMWAIELVIADEDGYTTLGNNFFLYSDPTSDLWTMIPWGPDQSFLEDLPVHQDYYGELAIRCAASAECAARLDERIAHVLDVWETSDMDGFVASETARIEAACRADPRSPWGDYGCRDAQEAMRTWVENRPGRVEQELGF